MPTPPPVSLVDRYLFENPWPAGIILLLIGILLLYIAANRGDTKRLLIGLGGVGLAVGLYLLATFVSTPAEHGENVTRELVRLAVEGKASQAGALFAPNASLSLGAPSNPGLSLSGIQRQLQSLDDEYEIRDNYITGLDAYSKNQDEAIVHLHCLTTFNAAFAGPTKSSWVLSIVRQTDGSWKIDRLTVIQINDQVPRLGWFQ